MLFEMHLKPQPCVGMQLWGFLRVAICLQISQSFLINFEQTFSIFLYRGTDSNSSKPFISNRSWSYRLCGRMCRVGFQEILCLVQFQMTPETNSQLRGDPRGKRNDWRKIILVRQNLLLINFKLKQMLTIKSGKQFSAIWDVCHENCLVMSLKKWFFKKYKPKKSWINHGIKMVQAKVKSEVIRCHPF